jgi:hypothetical protein
MHDPLDSAQRHGLGSEKMLPHSPKGWLVGRKSWASTALGCAD